MIELSEGVCVYLGIWIVLKVLVRGSESVLGLSSCLAVGVVPSLDGFVLGLMQRCEKTQVAFLQPKDWSSVAQVLEWSLRIQLLHLPGLFLVHVGLMEVWVVVVDLLFKLMASLSFDVHYLLPGKVTLIVRKHFFNFNFIIFIL